MLYVKTRNTDGMMCGMMDGMCMVSWFCMQKKKCFSVIRQNLNMRMCQ